MKGGKSELALFSRGLSSILICLEIALFAATLVVMLSVSTGTGFQLQDEVNSNSVD